MKKFKLVIVVMLFFAAGVVFGAAAIHRPIPNSPLELPPARKPWTSKDIMGLISSLGIRTFEGHLEILPFVVLETDRTFALKVPADKGMVHYVLVPKKDVHDISQISMDDEPYLMDIFLTARELVEKKGLYKYRFYTNGTGFQKVGYLHFHLVGKRKG